ncbi:hypothetical protein A3K73_03910 [Candidatus Pacearchaeota archaeon RBG_13_36_9]|nr:MAG: hypothetical protein A3K73_03910 [Candidatus Pacearchaeota archaeon RBG_13_36_9]
MGYHVDETAFKVYMGLFALVGTCALGCMAVYARGIYHRLIDHSNRFQKIDKNLAGINESLRKIAEGKLETGVKQDSG